MTISLNAEEWSRLLAYLRYPGIYGQPKALYACADRIEAALEHVQILLEIPERELSKLPGWVRENALP